MLLFKYSTYYRTLIYFLYTSGMKANAWFLTSLLKYIDYVKIYVHSEARLQIKVLKRKRTQSCRVYEL